MADWWTHYLDGNLIRREDTPLTIISTLEDWFDGDRSAMKRFLKGKPVAALALRKEIEKCVHENSLPREVDRLAALEVWVIRESALAASAKSLRDARHDFVLAVQDAGLSPYYASRITSDMEG